MARPAHSFRVRQHRRKNCSYGTVMARIAPIATPAHRFRDHTSARIGPTTPPCQELHLPQRQRIDFVYHSTSARIAPSTPPSQELLPSRGHGKNYPYDTTSARIAPTTLSFRPPQYQRRSCSLCIIIPRVATSTARQFSLRAVGGPSWCGGRGRSLPLGYWPTMTVYVFPSGGKTMSRVRCRHFPIECASGGLAKGIVACSPTPTIQCLVHGGVQCSRVQDETQQPTVTGHFSYLGLRDPIRT